MHERSLILTAFVLRHHLLGEADKIVVMFSRERGLRRAVAKGVRRPKSQLAGRIEPFIENRVELLKGRNLDKIVTLDGLRRFPAIVENLDALAVAMAAQELLLGLLEPDDPHPEVYDAWIELLCALETAGAPDVLWLTFELQVLDALGYRPALSHCSRCAEAFDQIRRASTWDAAGGGCVCQACSVAAPHGLRALSGGAWQLLRRLQQTPLGKAHAVQGAPAVLKQARQALLTYTAARCEREMKAQRMFDWCTP